MKLKRAVLVVMAVLALVSVAKANPSVGSEKVFYQLIAQGNYASVEKHVMPQNFLVADDRSAVKTGVILLEYSSIMTTEEVLVDMDRRGLRPAKAMELLRLGASPDFAKLNTAETAIVAFGTTARINEYLLSVLCLRNFNGRRTIGTMWYKYTWNQRARFAAAPK